jgi:hypothetical protein
MKTKQLISSQILILTLAVLMVLTMIQIAQAQDINQLNNIAQSNSTQNQAQPSQVNARGSAQVLQVKMPQKSLGRRILDNTSFTYYQQFLGPTMSGDSSQTYNVFQEGIDAPGTGRAPLQSFHAVNLRYQINNDWAIGTSLAAVNGYTSEVNNDGIVNRPDSEFFNARAYVSLPALRMPFGTLFSTLSYEAPTSSISRNDDMTWGFVLSESLAFNVKNPRWSVGILAQYYRAYFDHDRNVKPPQAIGFMPTQLQSVIVSGGPYANYRFNDNWMMGSLITLDWDQRGVQTDSREFNNNLPHRGRLSLNYFPTKVKYLTNIGVFAQALLKFRPETTAMGADFLVKF